ncbi:Maltokinase [Paraconexibacter sp. AEG42_29]|uniref:Maltokinase n=1 Tax=Paraconexibacter sp. AEG42_29 TaxID=2997339 RepID=A0AAU7ATR2_9ACTN
MIAIADVISEDTLAEYVMAQRWFGSRPEEVAGIGVIESIPLRDADPALALAIIEVRFHPGTHELYQLPIGRRATGSGWADGVICDDGEHVVYDAMTDPEFVRELLRLMSQRADLETEAGTAEFRCPDGDPIAVPTAVRALGAEQSNSSVILDDAHVLKAFRRLGAGVNPELEMLHFLSEHGFANIAPLRGWYGHTGKLIDATLGVAQDYVAGSTDGWDLALDLLGSGEPDAFVAHAARLGTVTGQLHTVLASDNAAEAFAPEETSTEALGLLTATVDEEIERIFRDLPDLPELEPLAGRGQEVRERLGALTVGSAGRTIRHHGDYHLGQVLLDAAGEWVILDFEGEPARSLAERRAKRSPLRDVAGMLRSFAYAATASRILNAKPAPEGWEAQVRTEFLDGYLDAADQTLLPPGRQAVERLLNVFELEKAVYELRYELDHRPDWVSIPVAGILRMLEGDDPS